MSNEGKNPEWCHFDMWKSAIDRGDELPTLLDFISACDKWHIGPLVLYMNAGNELLVYARGMDSPTLRFKLEGNKLVTLSATKCSWNFAGTFQNKYSRAAEVQPGKESSDDKDLTK